MFGIRACDGSSDAADKIPNPRVIAPRLLHDVWPVARPAQSRCRPPVRPVRPDQQTTPDAVHESRASDGDRHHENRWEYLSKCGGHPTAENGSVHFAHRSVFGTSRCMQSTKSQD